MRILAWAALLILLGLVPIAIGWSHLPDPTATHWGFGGVPDGNLPRAALPWLVVGIVAIGLVTTNLFRVEGQLSAESVAMVGLMGGVGIALTTSLVYLNWDAATWQEAGPFTFWHLIGVLVGAALFTTIGYQLGKRWYPLPAPGKDMVSPTIEIGDDESVSWVGTATVRWPFLLLGLVAVVFVFAMPGWFKLMALLFAVLAGLFSKVVALVNNAGLQVRLGGGVPVKKVRLEDIHSVQAIDVEPAAWGGWGWRIVKGGTAIVLRRGDAMEITYPGGRRFVVTVDDSATGVALLNGLVARLARQG